MMHYAQAGKLIFEDKHTDRTSFRFQNCTEQIISVATCLASNYYKE